MSRQVVAKKRQLCSNPVIMLHHFSKLMAALGTLPLSMLCLPAAAQSSLEPLVTDAKILLDGRLRFEFADQDGFAEDATALTGRLRFGFETGSVAGFTGLVEGDLNRDIGVDDFNSTINGKTRFPVVADPDSERLNRLQLSYKAPFESIDASATVGRQRIKFDDDRFVGNVGFRQNEQTYDAVRLRLSPIDKVEIDYTYLWHINRIFGSDSPVGEADADTHLINASAELPWGKLTGYAYLMDLDGPLAADSNQTYGLRFTGEQPLAAGLKALYLAEFANQTDYADTPERFDLNYLSVRGGLGYKGFSIKGGLDLLEGDGRRGFTTPLATLHKFQGFADLFLATPPSGLEDVVIEAQYLAKKLPILGDLRLAVWYHDFSAESGSGDFGEEIDWGLFITPWKGVTLSVEYADFHGSPLRGDLRRLWTTLSLSY